MESAFSEGKCVVLILPRGVTLGNGGMRLLVRYAQLRCGAAPWPYISAELFRGKSGETLLIARPARICRVFVADYALALIHKYFTD